MPIKKRIKLRENASRILELQNYPGKRLPVCFCLDTSASMTEDGKIDALNAGLRSFYKMLEENEATKYSAECAIVTFGGLKKVKVIRDFSLIANQAPLPVLTADGYTPMGEGVLKALELLETAKEQCKAQGVSYYRPWLVILSDGKPEGGDPAALAEAKRTVREYSIKKQVVPLSIPIGRLDEEALKHLREFGDGICVSMEETKMSDFFEWLHDSVSSSQTSDFDSKTSREIVDTILKQGIEWSIEDLKNMKNSETLEQLNL